MVGGEELFIRNREAADEDEDTGRGIVCLGVAFTAFKFSLKKIANKDKRERKRRSLRQLLSWAQIASQI